MKRTWFVSHPSGGLKHTPTFFSALNSFAEEHSEIDFVFPHENEEDVQLTRQDIESAELIIVEVSIPSTGSGIELGWASAAGKEIVAFHQGGAEPSPAIKFATKEIHTYVTENHVVEKLQQLITG